jgi:deoxyinosine 3'endonuclease (endonuclease V)
MITNQLTSLHPMTNAWRQRLIQLQNSMKTRLCRTPVTTPIRFVGGCDLTVDGKIMVGCFVVVDLELDCKSIYSKCSIVDVKIPYIPGLFCFREGPVVLQCLHEFTNARPDLRVDVLLVDGNGVWHERGFGLACYVGIESGIPTIGVSKTFLNTGSRHSSRQVQMEAQRKCAALGDVLMLHHVLEDGTVIECGVMRTTESLPFRPIFISAGHRMSSELAIDIVRDVCIFREPEPLRLADRLSRRFVKNLKKH